MSVMRRTATTWHLVLTARQGLEPFAPGPGQTAVVEALRGLAERGQAVVLAFCILPNQLDLLLAGDDAGAVATAVRSGVTRRVNRAVGRQGPLLHESQRFTEMPAEDDWVSLAEAIEQRAAAHGLSLAACSGAPEYAPWLRTAKPSPAPSRAAEPSPITVGQVIRVAEVATVVQLSEAVALGDAIEAGGQPCVESLTDYVGQWFLDESRTLAAVRAILAALARPTRGRGFFVAGLYGAGKSHLLAALSLVARLPEARHELIAAHPDLADLAPALAQVGPRLVVAVSLDEQPPARSLEDIVFEAAEESLRKLGVEHPLAETSHILEVVREHLLPRYRQKLDELAGGDWPTLADTSPTAAAAAAARLVAERQLPYRLHQSRVERLGRLMELAREAGRSGVLLLLDELSVYLASRPRRDLHADAGFLQFLGQRTALTPLWVVAALQKQIEDVGDIEHYTLRQIKDRFETRLALPLSGAHQVLARKVLPRRSPELLAAAVRACLTAWTGGQRHADLTPARLQESYPLHPLTSESLEACSERFLAQTRSMIEFAATRVRGDELAPGILERPSTALLTADELWDHFARDIIQHPDLRRYHEVVAAYYERQLPVLVGEDQGLALRVVKLLLVLRLAGLERGVRELAAALLPAAPDREERVAAILELLRKHGAYLVVERREGVGEDRYQIDLEFDVNETIRRRARSLEATLVVGDARLTATAVAACSAADFPLASTLHPHSASTIWRNTERRLFIAMRDLNSLSAQELENQAALLGTWDTAESTWLYLAEPQRTERQDAAFAAALASLHGDRWPRALVAWLPREASVEERRQWAADTALELLRQDPTLAGSAGSAVRERLDEEAGERSARLQALLRRLYLEGSLRSVDGRREITGSGWEATVEQAAGIALEAVFPRFASIAPIRGVLQRGMANDLIDGFIAPGAITISPASVRALAIEGVALPLGVAEGGQGEYRVAAGAGAGGPAEELLRTPWEGATSLAAFEARWAKGQWGLVTDQSHLLMAALVRRGHLVALGGNGLPVPLAAPLRAHVAALAPAPLLGRPDWERLSPLSKAIFGEPLGALDAAAQHLLFERLVRWREAALAAVASLRASVAETAARLGHDQLQWRVAGSTCDAVAAIAEAVDSRRLAADALRLLAAALPDPPGGIEELWRRFRLLAEFQDRWWPRISRVADELSTVSLPAGVLAEERDALLRRLAEGERVAFEATRLADDLSAWRRRYAEGYAAWHAQLHAAERFEAYDQLRVAPALRALANLSRLAIDIPDSATVVAGSLQAERRKQCPRSDVSLALRDLLVCPDCELPWGAELPLRPVEELLAEARRGVGQILRLLRSAPWRNQIEEGLATLPSADPRVRSAEVLLGPAVEDEEILANSSFATIELLNSLMLTKSAARRSVTELSRRLEGKRLTKGQAADAMAQWLDPEGNLAPSDLVEFEP